MTRAGVRLGLGLVLVLGWAWAAWGQGGAIQRVRVFGTTHVQAILVDHAGYQTAWALQSGAWNIAHISSVLHVAGAVTVSQAAVNQSGSWTVQAAHQAGTWNLQHISSVVHVSAAGTPWAVNMALAVRCVNTGATAFEACGGAGSAADAVNVFHESTIRHISSVTHVVGSVRLINVAGTIASFLNATSVAVSNVAGQSGLWTVQAAHQGGEWNVRHVSSITHVAGTMMLAAKYGGTVFVTHFGALAVTCYTNAGVAESCAGSGGASDSVNVFHQSTIRHISSVTHVAGTVSLVNQAGTYATFLGSSLSVASSAGQSGVWTLQNAHILAGVPQSGSWTIQAAHQGGQWNVAHVGSVLHVTIVGQARNLRTRAFSLTATGTVVPAISGLRIRVYAVKLVASAAISVNFRDGTGDDLEGAQPLAINGGFVEIILPPASLFHTTAGNSLDLVISGVGTAAGRVSYFAE